MDNEIDDFSGDNDRRNKDRKIQNVRAWADPGGVLPVVDTVNANIPLRPLAAANVVADIGGIKSADAARAYPA